MMPPYAALILAGGQARRMGGEDKGLVKWAGHPLVTWVHAALLAQTPAPATVLLSANRSFAAYAALNFTPLPDLTPDFAGPLAGMEAGLVACPHDWLLVVPCDAITLPPDLVTQLWQAAQAGDAASAVCAGDWHPSVVLLHRRTLPSLQAYLSGSTRSIRGWLAGRAHQTVSFAAALPNLNTLAAVAAHLPLSAVV